MNTDRLKKLAGLRESNSVFELVGFRSEPGYTYGGYTGETIDKEEVVATFDSEEAARAYAEKSKLRKASYSRGATKAFRSNSLLAGFDSYSVNEKVDDIAPPHNPG